MPRARAALDAAEWAQRRVAEEVGLPRAYWWGMAAGWVVLGVIGSVGPQWLAVIVAAIIGFGGHIAALQEIVAGATPPEGSA